MEHLSRYDRVTVGLWARSYAELARSLKDACLPEAAVHAVLARLRRCAEPRALLSCYEHDGAADFALIGSLVDGNSRDALFLQLRDAAYHLRWRELAERNGGAD